MHLESAKCGNVCKATTIVNKNEPEFSDFCILYISHSKTQSCKNQLMLNLHIINSIKWPVERDRVDVVYSIPVKNIYINIFVVVMIQTQGKSPTKVNDTFIQESKLYKHFRFMTVTMCTTK